MAAALREGVTADELEAGSGHRDPEGERVVAVLGPDVGAGIDRQLVRERRQRGEHASPSNDDAVLGVAYLVERHLAGGLLGLGLRPVDLRIHDRVRGGQVAVAHQLLVGDDVRGAVLVAATRPDVGAAGEAGERHVQVVGRPAHHSCGRGGGELEGLAPPLEVLLRPRDDVRDVDERAVVGRGHEHLVGVLVLEIEDPGDGVGRLRELRMLERVRDALAVQPDLARVSGEAVEELLARSGPNLRGGLGGRHTVSFRS